MTTGDSELREEIIDWLKEENLWQEVSSNERRFLETENPIKKAQVKYSWYAECVYLIGWALGLESALLPPCEQASAGNILDQIPAPNEATGTFIASVKLRKTDEIYKVAEDLFNAHAWCRLAQSQNRPERHGFDIEVT